MVRRLSVTPLAVTPLAVTPLAVTPLAVTLFAVCILSLARGAVAAPPVREIVPPRLSQTPPDRPGEVLTLVLADPPGGKLAPRRLAAPEARVQPFPTDFRTQEIAAGGVTIHTRVGGKGPAVILLHGYGETGDMWAPLAADLARDHTVIVPDLRGMGLSSRPESGYDKKTQAGDIAHALDALNVERADLVTHDIGNMVGYAFAAQYPARVTKFILMDAPLPGIGPWDQIVRSHALWHFSFWGPDAERLVAGRERIYLDRFWNEFSADPRTFSEAARRHYASLYAMPGAMHAGFAQFAAFDQDVIDNQALLAKGKLTMPVLAIGGEKSFGPTMAVVMRAVATNVREVTIPNSGHWLMEEQRGPTIAAVRAFLDGTS